MRRTDRLFQIIQVLRGSRRPVTAAVLARELETSVRTIYRDIVDLMAQRVPIRGEAGIGYVLEDGYEMPPLMLTPDEIEAAVLGAAWVARNGDPALARGARDLIAKIGDVVPTHLRPVLFDSMITAASHATPAPDTIDMARLRAAIRNRGKVRIVYATEGTRVSERVVWPIFVAYFESIRMIAAWCEMREGFRNFRTDRIRAADFLDDRYNVDVKRLRSDWWAHELSRGRYAVPDS